jgi:hypothetical protein
LAHIAVSEPEPTIMMLFRHIGMFVLIEISKYQHATALHDARHLSNTRCRILDVVKIHIGKSIIDEIVVDWQSIRIATPIREAQHGAPKITG